ncbi:MAG: hypothetical protein M3Z25_18150 [Actinomycetota bacterium]|nr:hypothetical protein [Actinomycetota bacterium]
MVEVTVLDGWVDQLAGVAVATADTMLRETGFVAPPTVHMLSGEVDPPYVGYLACRAFYRGADAEVAVAGLGVLPAALGVSRLVLTWEHSDLCTALELPDDDGFLTGVVVVDADQHGHTVRWHPMRLHLGPDNDAGLPTVRPEWGPVQHVRDQLLLDPVARLLEVWREDRGWPDTEVVRACVVGGCGLSDAVGHP